MTDLETFRGETRAWLEENCPGEMRKHGDVAWGGRNAEWSCDDQRLWMERMADMGWTVPTWPREFGGAGLSKGEDRVLKQEMRDLGCRTPLNSFGIMMLGPVVLEYGTDEQKRRFLPPIARGEIRWCQGYSEPGAGSDLASLQCRAIRDGDEYIVNGQKVWTSEAHLSDWIFCLVRTNTDAPKQDGISFLLIDMDDPGVEARPIELISGSSIFCQTFFDDVRVPVQNRLGNENAGWPIAKKLLQHERNAVSAQTGSGSANSTRRRRTLVDDARTALGTPEGQLPDADLRDRIVRFELDQLCFKATMQRSADGARAGPSVGPETSMFKLYQTELSKRKADLRVRARGVNALGWSGDTFASDDLKATRRWLMTKAESIASGTSEIQRNIIAKRVLGLPD